MAINGCWFSFGFKTTQKEKIVFSGLLPGMLVKATVKQVRCFSFFSRDRCLGGGGGVHGNLDEKNIFEEYEIVLVHP